MSYRVLDTVARDSGRDSYSVIADRLSRRQSFAGTSMHAFIAEDGTYVVCSYKTVIATVSNDGTVEIQQNLWGPTTGRHINMCKAALSS
jgi:hypothetical protein